MRVLATCWLTALVFGCVGVYMLGAAEDVVGRWRTRRRRWC